MATQFTILPSAFPGAALLPAVQGENLAGKEAKWRQGEGVLWHRGAALGQLFLRGCTEEPLILFGQMGAGSAQTPSQSQEELRESRTGCFTAVKPHNSPLLRGKGNRKNTYRAQQSPVQPLCPDPSQNADKTLGCRQGGSSLA
ncbi:hypothetical protein DV515_00006662 [Chloebia gouldiae]|uniref:Uncharacterized protein n=1 Tax=Chloebia gouldiae TaxID=44316 RepID=A0A3L8SJZ6_CHLGU|nr:hypothetical protein DV515_00006662 [Chloebia gouldiae]